MEMKIICMKLKCHIKQKRTKFRESLKALQLACSLTALTCTPVSSDCM